MQLFMLLLSNDGMDNFFPFYIFFSFLLIFSAGMDHCSDKPVSREPGDVHGIVFQVDQLHFYSSKNINGSEWLVKSAEYCCRKCFFLEHHGDCAECVRPARHPMGDGGRPNFSFTFFIRMYNLVCLFNSSCFILFRRATSTTCSSKMFTSTANSLRVWTTLKQINTSMI